MGRMGYMSSADELNGYAGRDVWIVCCAAIWG